MSASLAAYWLVNYRIGFTYGRGAATKDYWASLFCSNKVELSGYLADLALSPSYRVLVCVVLDRSVSSLPQPLPSRQYTILVVRGGAGRDRLEVPFDLLSINARSLFSSPEQLRRLLPR